MAVILVMTCITSSVFAENADITSESSVGTVASEDEQQLSETEELKHRQEAKDEFESLSRELKLMDEGINSNESDEGVSLFATNYTVSGTVTLPSGVTASAGDIIRVYAYNPPEVYDGLVVSDSSSVKSTTVTLSSGQTSASYSISLPKGEYTFAVRYLSGNKNVSGKMMYYTSDGITANEYAADVVTVSGTVKNINMTLYKAESYISGTIDLSKNVPTTDTYIGLSFNSNSASLWISQYVYISVKAGTTSVDYEIGVDPSYFSMYVNSNYFDTGYYSNGSVTVYKYRTILDATSPLENVDVVISESSSAGGEECAITINFAKAATETKTIIAAFSNEYGEVYDNAWLTLVEGESSLSFSLISEPIDNLMFFYKDMTGFSSVTWELDESCRFYSSELGYTSNVKKATNVSGMTSITVSEPESFTVSGSISSGSGDAVRKYVYVGAEFEDESFCTAVNIAEGTYSVDVPKRHLGETFEMFTAIGSYACLDADTKIYNDSTYTLTKSLSGIDVTAPAFRTVSGTIYLPIAAPSSGLNINLYYDSQYDYDDIGILVVPTGAKTVNYSVVIPEDIPEDGYITAGIEAYEKIAMPSQAFSESLTSKEDIYFEEAATINGTVSLPSGTVFDKDITLQICAQNNDGVYEYMYTSVLAGKSSASYELTYPKDVALNYLFVQIQTEGFDLFDRVYYKSDGQTSSSSVNLNITVSEGMTADFTLMKASVVKGTISLPSTASYKGGEIGYNITCTDINTNSSYSKTYWIYTPYAENKFSIAVPNDDDAKYILSVYVYDAGNSDIMEYAYSYYVSDTAMTSSKNVATSVTAGNSYKLSFPVGASISGTISFEEGSYVEGGYLYGYIYAEAVSSGAVYSYYIDNMTTVGDIDYKISIPDNSGETYKVYVRMYNYNCEVTNIPNAQYYYSASGATTSAESATAVSQGADVDIKIPKMRSVSGKITVPSDYKSIDDMGKVSAYLRSSSNGTKYTSAYIDENLNYNIFISDDIYGSYSVELLLGDCAINNIVRDFYKYTDDEGATATFNIPEGKSVSGINISAKTGWAISGKIMLPADAVLEYTEFTPNVYYGYNSRNCSKALSNTTRSVNYMFGVDKTNTSSYYMAASSGSKSTWNSDSAYSNLYEGMVYYVDNSTAATNSSAAKNFTFSSDMSDIDITLKTGALFNVQMNAPSDITSDVYGYIYFADENGNQLASQYFSLWEYKLSQTVTKTFDKNLIGDKIYLYYELNSNANDDFYKGRLYINPDGTYAHSRSQATPFTLANTQTASFSVVKNSNVVLPKYVLESDHPYATDFEKTYEYVHSDASAEQLYVTFSESTKLGSGDYIYIYDVNDNQIGYYSYSSLSGKTIKVTGNGFKIKLVSNSYGTDYGFAVESVVSKLTHTVTFKNYDGTILSTQTAEHGAYVSYQGTTPARNDDALYTYNFSGWDVSLSNVTSDLVATARYKATEKYTLSLTALADGGYEYTVVNNTSNYTEATLVFASYDDNGNLIQAKTENIAFSYNISDNLELDMHESGTIKIMLWNKNGNIQPVAKSCTADY